MSRIRTVKPEFWTSEQVMECSPLARLAFIGMWNFCDDNGVHPASCKTLKAEVFPGDDLTAADVQTLVNELLQQRLLVEFHAESRRWWFVTGWHHQLINRPSKSRYPLPPRPAPLPKAAGPDADQDQPETTATHGALTENTVNPHGVLTERSLLEGKGKEGNETGKEGERKGTDTAPARHARAPKTPLPADLAITPELQAWAEQHGYGDLAAYLDHFRDKATAKGYQYADWDAAFRNAVRDDWAGLRKKPAGVTTQPDFPVSRLSQAGEQQRRNLEVWLQQDTAEVVAYELH